jgi:hypothetical protein
MRRKRAAGGAALGKRRAACEAPRRGDLPMADEDQPVPSLRPLSPQFIHVLRTAQTMHLQLSQMADQKASILMGATFVIFTIAIGQSRDGTPPPLPLAILGIFAFFSAVLAMSAVMPVIGPSLRRSKLPLNLLFFGSFTQLSEAEFVARLREKVTEDHGSLELMARDLYQNGQVLKRKKYRLLGWAYRVFLVGLTLSFVAFVVQMIAPVAAMLGWR